METVVINNSTPQTQQSSSPLNRIITIGIWILVITLVVIIGFGAYLLIDNWDYIVTFFTTGFIGWLNPFDNPADDQGPIDSAIEATGLKGPTNTWLSVWRAVPILGRLAPDNVE